MLNNRDKRGQIKNFVPRLQTFFKHNMSPFTVIGSHSHHTMKRCPSYDLPGRQVWFQESGVGEDGKTERRMCQGTVTGMDGKKSIHTDGRRKRYKMTLYVPVPVP